MINYLKDQIQEVEMVESNKLSQIEYIEGIILMLIHI